MSGRAIVATFCPTVGTVFPGLGAGAPSERGWYSALIWERSVVLPALSNPSRITEYSAVQGNQRGRLCDRRE